MQSVIKVLGIALLFLGLAQSAEAQTGPWSTQGPSNCSDQYGSFDAFIPGMRGSGSCNRGGFVPGTSVIVVTNRNGSGSGSFREAIRASCPKVILFGVAGLITNTDNPLQTATCDDWSIVGSSAPGNITLHGSNGAQFQTHGDNFTMGHMTIPSGNNDDALAQGGFAQGPHDNGLIYNSTFLWAPLSSTIQCYPNNSPDWPQTNLLYWQNILMVSVKSAIGLHLLQNTCKNVNTIRSIYMDSRARVPLVRGDGYYHANNVHINMENDFSRIQPCDGGLHGSVDNPVRMSFVNNYYAEGPGTIGGGNGDYITLNDSSACTNLNVWEDGTRAMASPGNVIQNCANHGCTMGLSAGDLENSDITAIRPAGYVPESITNDQAGHVEFVDQIATFAGSRPNERFTYVQDRINESINAVDGSGATSSWSPSATVASEGTVSVITETPRSGYDPTSGGQNPCSENMPTGSVADAIQSSGLTRLHEWAIGCFFDNVMPAGYREDKLQNYPAPGGGSSGPPPPSQPTPNPPELS